jgi:hypothetical protein
MARDVSRRWNTLISHLMLIAQKLEEQGYAYDELESRIIESEET